MRVEPKPRGLGAEGVIVDDDGATVAHREVLGPAGDCDGMANALGVWASLVFDAELARVQAHADASHDAGHPEEEGAPAASSSATPPPEIPPWPAAPPPASAHVQSERPPPEAEHLGSAYRDDVRTVELGVGGFVMTGMGPSPVVGPSPYVVVEVGPGVFLRPSLAMGWSAPVGGTVDAHETWAAARFDTCLRLSGLYMQQRGMQLDTCGGADLGFTHMSGAPAGDKTAGVAATDVTLPYLSVGPSLALRGELNGDLAAALRLMGGLNIIQQGYDDASGVRVDPSWFSARLELALSWRLR
jgi:hypothetical protein